MFQLVKDSEPFWNGFSIACLCAFIVFLILFIRAYRRYSKGLNKYIEKKFNSGYGLIKPSKRGLKVEYRTYEGRRLFAGALLLFSCTVGSLAGFLLYGFDVISDRSISNSTEHYYKVHSVTELQGDKLDLYTDDGNKHEVCTYLLSSDGNTFRLDYCKSAGESSSLPSVR